MPSRAHPPTADFLNEGNTVVGPFKTWGGRRCGPEKSWMRLVYILSPTFTTVVPRDLA